MQQGGVLPIDTCGYHLQFVSWNIHAMLQIKCSIRSYSKAPVFQAKVAVSKVNDRWFQKIRRIAVSTHEIHGPCTRMTRTNQFSAFTNVKRIHFSSDLDMVNHPCTIEALRLRKDFSCCRLLRMVAEPTNGSSCIEP